MVRACDEFVKDVDCPGFDRYSRFRFKLSISLQTDEISHILEKNYISMNGERNPHNDTIIPPSPAATVKSASSKRKKAEVFIAREISLSDGYAFCILDFLLPQS